VGKGPISARAAIQAVTKKEARKRPQKKPVLEVDSGSDDDDVAGTEHETLHPELRDWDNGRSNMLLVRLRDPFKEQQDEIRFN
jgi:hypothetical protein